MIAFVMLDHRLPPADWLGYLPGFLSDQDSRTMKEQINANYQHGGGWSPFGEGQWKMNPETHALKFPEDPPLNPVALAQIREETLFVYPHGVCAIVQKDGSFEVARLD